MTTRVLIEKLESAHLSYAEIHLDVLLNAEAGNTSVYSNPYYEGPAYRFEASEIGRKIMDDIRHIPGIGQVMCSSYSFTFNTALAFNAVDIIDQVVSIIGHVLGDELDIHLLESKRSLPFKVESDELVGMLELLMA